MPAIILKSISILSDAGLGMAMFSLGPCSTLLSCPSANGTVNTATDNARSEMQVCSWLCSRGSSRAGTRWRRSP
jgi:hypothetical protein